MPSSRRARPPRERRGGVLVRPGDGPGAPRLGRRRGRSAARRRVAFSHRDLSLGEVVHGDQDARAGVRARLLANEELRGVAAVDRTLERAVRGRLCGGLAVDSHLHVVRRVDDLIGDGRDDDLPLVFRALGGHPHRSFALLGHFDGRVVAVLHDVGDGLTARLALLHHVHLGGRLAAGDQLFLLLVVLGTALRIRAEREFAVSFEARGDVPLIVHREFAVTDDEEDAFRTVLGRHDDPLTALTRGLGGTGQIDCYVLAVVAGTHHQHSTVVVVCTERRPAFGAHRSARLALRVERDSRPSDVGGGTQFDIGREAAATFCLTLRLDFH